MPNASKSELLLAWKKLQKEKAELAYKIIKNFIESQNLNKTNSRFQ